MDEFLWVEKYRPKTIQDCILPGKLKDTFKEMVEEGEAQNLLMAGGPGCGKTTVARALANDLGSEYILINCSEDGNIDTLRTKIRNFASTVALTDAKKIVILDEFDYSNPQSTQPALRGFIEEFSKNCRFILTCNYKNRIIEPLHSRCTVVDFKIPSKEKPKLAMKILGRIQEILGKEEVEFDQEVLAKLIMKHFPDIRRILNELQRYATSGKIDVAVYRLGDRVYLEVMDSGPGIPANQYQRVFERFYRVGGDRHNSGVTGCGLGLSIVQRIVALHAAEIELGPSRFATGLKVTVIFPRNVRPG